MLEQGVATAPDAHAKLAPSSASRWVACPGSVGLESLIPEPPQSEAAREGTEAHDVAAQMLASWPRYDPGWFPSEPQEACRVYCELVAPLGELGTLHIESREQYTADIWGTVDAWVFDANRNAVYVADFKYGFAPVEALENWQLIAYAAAVAQRINPTPATYFELIICQPRAWHIEGRIRRWGVTWAELQPYISDLAVAALQAMAPGAPTKTGPHCKYCKARYSCVTLQRAAAEAMQYAGVASPLPRNPEAMAVELHLLRQAAELIDYRLNGYYAEAERMAREGQALPGWRMAYGGGRYKWTRPTAEAVALGQLYGVDIMKPPEPITPAQARDKGIPADVLKQYSERLPGKARLEPVDTAALGKVFR